MQCGCIVTYHHDTTSPLFHATHKGKKKKEGRQTITKGFDWLVEPFPSSSLCRMSGSDCIKCWLCCILIIVLFSGAIFQHFSLFVRLIQPWPINVVCDSAQKRWLLLCVLQNTSRWTEKYTRFSSALRSSISKKNQKNTTIKKPDCHLFSFISPQSKMSVCSNITVVITWHHFS